MTQPRYVEQQNEEKYRFMSGRFDYKKKKKKNMNSLLRPNSKIRKKRNCSRTCLSRHVSLGPG